jgi:hypothetical protein
MQPNKDTPEDLLFRCECGSEYLELYREEKGIWINCTTYPTSFLQVLKWWLGQRKTYNFDVLLRDSDVKTLRDNLDTYLKKQKQPLR